MQGLARMHLTDGPQPLRTHVRYWVQRIARMSAFRRRNSPLAFLRRYRCEVEIWGEVALVRRGVGRNTTTSAACASKISANSFAEAGV